ncbi:MAG: hypothetical protein KY467_13715 [Gemmatimonadetes bacterium]|nr:hypothetical protein [Gemmatimonadota bacterium]
MTTRLARAAVAAAALLAGGCRGGGTDSSQLPLRFRVQPAGTVAPGDSMRMTAYLVNPGSRPVRLEFENQCQVEFYVQAPDKTVLHPPGGGTTCVGAPTVLELAARDSVRFDDAWLVASTYALDHTAYAVLWEHHQARGEEREYERGHRSNIVTFRLAEPQQ